MKKFIVLLAASLLFLTGCSSADTEKDTPTEPVEVVEEEEVMEEVVEPESEERILLTFENMSEYNSPDNPNCDARFDFSEPDTKEPYIDMGKGFFFQVPFNSKWGGEKFKILPSEMKDDTVHFGPISGFEACTWIRPYQMRYLPSQTAKEVIAEVNDLNTPELLSYKPEIIKITNLDGDEMQVVKYSSTGMCDYPAMQIIGKTHNYEFSTVCSTDIDEDFAFFEGIMKTVESGMGEMAIKEFDVPDEVVTYEYNGDLEDVSGGNATGTAGALYNEDGYMMYAEFEDLPHPEAGFFYEGWVVKQSPLDVISSGAADVSNGVYSNTFTSEEDLTDHTFYVLTLEPDDGDPAPAEHILEGTMTK